MYSVLTRWSETWPASGARRLRDTRWKSGAQAPGTAASCRTRLAAVNVKRDGRLVWTIRACIGRKVTFWLEKWPGSRIVAKFCPKMTAFRRSRSDLKAMTARRHGATEYFRGKPRRQRLLAQQNRITKPSAPEPGKATMSSAAMAKFGKATGTGSLARQARKACERLAVFAGDRARCVLCGEQP